MCPNEIIQSPWENKLLWRIRELEKELFIICPYIKRRIAELVIGALPKHLEVGFHLNILTRFDLNDFLSGASDFEAIELFLELSIPKVSKEIRFLNNLHSKIYIFDKKEAIITSSNLTTPGLNNNIEIGVSTFDEQIINDLDRIARTYWDIAPPITKAMLKSYESLLFQQDIVSNTPSVQIQTMPTISRVAIPDSLSDVLFNKAFVTPKGLDDEPLGIKLERLGSIKKRRNGICQ